ncbi:MAG: lysophospholipid acyltransferase family protein [Gemmatimonadaceae bacterium]|nr:lysophospholipid acyltransferase family protein [Gemmatimonadaceae bacterium]
MIHSLASTSGPDASQAPVPTSSGTSGVADWRLGPQTPQTKGWLLRRVGLWILTRAGWRFEGAMPDIPKFVAIVAPHTSNWDFPIGLAAKWALGFDTHWWGKDSLFAPPLGWFMRANGGIPVQRKQSSKVVETTIDAFRANDRFALALAPEGTRKKVTKWRTGFWHVAKGAQVPICCVAFDWPRKVIRLGPTTMPDEDDQAAGIARIRSYFANVRGYNPAQQA